MKKWAALLIFGGIVTPLLSISHTAYASNSSPVIAQLQTGGVGSVSQEFIALYNNSDQAVDITDWCVIYDTFSNDTHTNLTCFTPPDPQTDIVLAVHSYLTLATSEFIAAHPGFVPNYSFSSPSISATGGHIRLVDASPTKVEIDRLGWGTAATPETKAAVAPPAGKLLERLDSSVTIRQDTDNNFLDFAIDACSNLEGVQASPPTGYLQDANGDCYPDVCPNLAGLQASLPAGKELDANGNCVDHDECDNLPGIQASLPAGYTRGTGHSCVLDLLPLTLSELLPNAAGTDAGQEFIELYNPNTSAVDLAAYVLHVGPNYENSYSFPAGATIGPGQYRVFSDADINYTLLNSSSRVKLAGVDGSLVSETASYTDPKDDEAWALIDGLWQYTNQPTPSADNLPMRIEEGEGENPGSSLPATLVPCREDQERNPETNRCRLIQTAAASLVPCATGQERNPATNRCRSILASDDDNLVPCKEGQERNPETNRCRSIASAASALVPCAAGQERNPETNRCRKSAGGATTGGIAGVKDVASGSIGNNPKWLLAGLAVVAALGYAAYEWRQEVINSLGKLKTKFSLNSR